jgi:putative intracellular protease/amidase
MVTIPYRHTDVSKDQKDAYLSNQDARLILEKSTMAGSKRILMIVSNPSVSTTLGVPVGFWGSELTHPWLAFREARYEVTIASPMGGKLEMDALSDPRDTSGYSAHDIITMGFVHTPSCTAMLENTPALAAVDPADFDAVLVCGGQGPMFTFRGNSNLAKVIQTFWEGGKPVAALCHGVAALVDMPWIEGRTMTGFSNAEEDIADSITGTRVMPWRIEDAALASGANFIRAAVWQAFAIRDGQLITGQQQYSGGATARLVIEALGA